MPISIHASGTRTSSSSPETNFTVLGNTNDSNIGAYQFFINMGNMKSGDRVDIQVLEKTISSGDQNVIYTASLAGAQTDPVWVSPTLLLYYSWQLQHRQSAGLSRTYDWSIRKVT